MTKARNSRKGGKGKGKGKGVGKNDHHAKRKDGGRSFGDLPPELIVKIIQLAEKLYPLLLTCKRTCEPAGRLLYIDTWNEVRYCDRQPRLSALVRGIEHPHPAKAAPFGPDLKLRFLSQVETLEICLTKGELYLPGVSEASFDSALSALEAARKNSIVAFPSVRSISCTGPELGDTVPYRQDVSSTPVNDNRMIAALVAVSRPQYICRSAPAAAGPSFKTGSNRPACVLRSAPISDADSSDARGFAVPEIVTQHLSRVPADLLVYYGTHNRITIDVGWTSRLLMDEDLRYLVIAGLLRQAHPEFDPTVKAELSQAELELRNATTWSVVMMQYDRDEIASNESNDGPEPRSVLDVEKLLELTPELRGRVTVDAPDSFLLMCEGCGLDLSTDFTFAVQLQTEEQNDQDYYYDEWYYDDDVGIDEDNAWYHHEYSFYSGGQDGDDNWSGGYGF